MLHRALLLALLAPPVLGQAHLTASDAEANDRFGYAVDLDAAGTRLVVGTRGEDTLGNQAGAVYVFFDGGGGWAEEQKLLPSDGGPNDAFGRSVAISDDGTRLVVGANREDQAAQDAGAAYVFARSGTTWTEEAKLLGSDVTGIGSWFGYACAIDGDGDALVVHARWAQASYVFERTGTTWAETAKITHPGITIADNVGMNDAGTRLVASLQVWDKVGGAWTQTHVLPGPAVCMSAAGDVVASSTRVFRFDGTAWNQEYQFTGPFTEGYGRSTSINGAGTRYVVGNDTEGTGPGRLHVFAYDGAAWGLEEVLFSIGQTQDDDFGWDAALDASGDLLAVSAPYSDEAASRAGAVFVRGPDGVWVFCVAKPNSLGCAATLSTAGTPSAASGQPFVITASNVLNFRNGLLFYGVNGPAGLPFNGGTLCAAPPLRRTPIQNAGGTPPPASDCTGAIPYDFNALVASGADPLLVLGTVVDAQFWLRDPQNPDGTGVALTGGVQFSIGP